YQVGGQHEALLTALSRTAHRFASDGPKTVDGLLPYGNYYYERRQFSRARDVMQALLAIFPDSAPLMSSLGVVRFEAEELEQSMALFRRAHELAPKDMLIVRNLATDAMYLGQLAHAAAALETLRASRPGETHISFELAAV